MIHLLLLFSILLYITNGVTGVNRTCPIVSPNNPPDVVAAGCVDGTSKFFFSTEPEMYLPERCICCQPGTDDNPPDNCAFDDTLYDFEGIVTCSENFDCCLCGKIICNDCKEIGCGGDESCIGVDEIYINGSRTDGASYTCNGDVSCFATKVYGNQVSSCDCNGDFSCSNSSMWLNLNETSVVEALTLGFTGDHSGAYTTVVAQKVGFLGCVGDDACPGSYMDLDCIEFPGCLLDLNGDNAANDAIWNINYASGFKGNGDNCAENTKFNINFISSGGSATITGDRAAADSVWDMTNCNALRCVSGEGCHNTTFNIAFIPDNKDNAVEIAGIDGAAFSRWGLTNPSGISCGNLRSCQGMILRAECVGVGAGDTNGCNVDCIGGEACDNCDMIVSNVNQFTCTESNACSNGYYDMTCLDNGCPMSCGGACRNSTFKLWNSNGLSCSGQIPVLNSMGIITRFEGSCEHSQFWMNNNIGGNINCGAGLACHNTTIASSDSTDGYITNLGTQGISCGSDRACYDSLIKAKCSDMIEGCPLYCTGPLACGIENNINHIIGLKGAKSLSCIGGSIGSDAFSACGDRTFKLYPVKPSFTTSCSGSYGCANATMDIDGEFAGTTFGSSETKCDALSACAGTVMNYFAIPGQEIKLSGKVGCNAEKACYGLSLNMFINEITDKVLIDLMECTSVSSCDLASLNVFMKDLTDVNDTDGDGFIGYRLLSISEIETKESEGTFQLGMICQIESFCSGAYINNGRTFFQHVSLNADEPEIEKPKLINQLGTVWVIIIGILAIALIIVIRKNYQYRKIEKNMEQAVNDAKGKYNSPNNKAVAAPSPIDNDDDIEIRYNENQTKDVI